MYNISPDSLKRIESILAGSYNSWILAEIIKDLRGISHGDPIDLSIEELIDISLAHYENTKGTIFQISENAFVQEGYIYFADSIDTFLDEYSLTASQVKAID